MRIQGAPPAPARAGSLGWVHSLRRLPCKPLWLLTALCLVIREEFPFSHFPMYSSFGRSTYYVHLADSTGSPLPTVATLGVSTPTLKKIYESEVRGEMKRIPKASRQRLSIAQRQPAGKRVLQRLSNSTSTGQSEAPRATGLRLYEVRISLEGGQFQKRRELIAELP